LAGLLGTLDATVPLLEAAAQRSRDLIRLALRGEELRRRLAAWLAQLDAAAADGSPAASRGDGPAFDDGDRGRSPAPGDEAEPDPMLDEAVLWSEVHQGGVTLHATPLSVAPALKRHRQQHLRAWVFVSATLSVAGDFRHFTESVGMSDA